MSLTENIKEELDRDCDKRNQHGFTKRGCKSVKGCAKEYDADGEKLESPDCFRCHKHDALAARIADRLTEVRT